MEQQDEQNDVPVSTTKKARLFSTKEFRSQLGTSANTSALQHFLQLCHDKEYDYVFEYLENGGNCLELFQLLEINNQIPPSLILDIVNQILLQIVLNYPQFHASAYESCRYFLNTHLAIINKMLGLASSNKERTIILKLLTSIVTFSKNLAKDVLLHVSFNPTNLEVLTKPAVGKDSVRNAFVHFLVSFLVEGEYPTISILLDKKGLLSSIINGLFFDAAETVSMVMMTLKKHILENLFVSKTKKMSTFSTPVVKDIVKLYNWKGPQSINSKKSLQTVPINEEDKTLVNESVHAFLLVLCTSHKFGVIFRDRQLGLGKRTQNSLMYTVLESLERPWEHSYAGELVTKICGACPDLAKTLWANLKTLLEPRATTRWLNAVKYASVLVDELKPASIDFCAQELNVYQLVQIIQFLVLPTPILKTIVPENGVFENATVKHHVLSLLVHFLKSIRKYTCAAEKWTKPNDLRILKNLLTEHVARNFPTAQEVLRDWSISDERMTCSVSDRLRVIFDLLDLYEDTCAQLLETLTNVNLQSLLEEIEMVPLQIRAIKLFFNFEPSMFSLKSNLFAITFPLILQCYFETGNAEAETTLNLLLRNSGIFEGNTEEIQYWIDAVFDLQYLDIDTCQTILEMMKHTFEDVFGYIVKMQGFSKNFDSKIEGNHREIIENLRRGFVDDTANVSTKHTGLSPLLLGALEHLNGKEQTKNFKNYFNSVLVNLFHSQTMPSLMFLMVSNEKYKDVVSKHVLAYIEGWTNGRGCILVKTKLVLAQTTSASFLGGDLDDVLTDDLRPGQIQNCLDQVLFYFNNLPENELTDVHVRNCTKMIRFSRPEIVPSKIFGNPSFLQRFSPSHKIVTTRFLIDVVKEFSNSEEHLKPYRAKIVGALKKVFKRTTKKPNKFEDLSEILEVFGLERRHCLEVLKFYAALDFACLEGDSFGFYYNMIVYAMKKYLDRIDNLQPLDDEIVGKIVELLSFLNGNVDRLDASACHKVFRDYLNYFPHNLENVTLELFESIVTRKGEFCREAALLAELLLSKKIDFLDVFAQHLIGVASKKGLMLPLLRAAIAVGASDDFLKGAYECFGASISKGLQKPKKAGQYFEMYSDALVVLINKFMPVDDCTVYTEKVHKFDTSEPFHVRMLEAIFTKAVFANDRDKSEGRFTNCFLTFVHVANLIFKRKDKSEDDWIKLEKIVRCSDDFFRNVADDVRATKFSLRTLCQSDSFDLFCKYCLKFGMSGKAFLLGAATSLVRFVDFRDDEAKTLLEMAGSHSEFLDVVLGENCDRKTSLLDFILALCRRWPSIMERNHVSVLLSAYNGTVCPSDRVLLILLQMYEKESNKTNFYDFKPFLWGKAAATHYSVRQDIQKALWRQPRMGDILDILEEHLVHNTICNYPLSWDLTATKSKCENKPMYDLTFFLPLFGSLLAPENEVATYKFVKSGALSLTIVALGSQNKEVRLAACHVLARLHYHVEARQGGKDRLLWLRFVEAICRGMAVLIDVKLNNFGAIFWARMALILTRPLHPLYVPLSHYLSAKVAPDLTAIPELYTFLHTPDVNFKDTRGFILEILQDGLRTDSDFLVALHAMAFKLIMELFSSCLADVDTKRSILLIIERACKLDSGRKLLCSSYGLLSWLYEATVTLDGKERTILPIIVRIVHLVSKNRGQDFSIVSLIVEHIVDDDSVDSLPECDLLLETVLEIINVNRDFLTEERLKRLIATTNNTKYEYLLRYGCKFTTTDTSSTQITNLLHTIIVKWTNK